MVLYVLQAGWWIDQTGNYSSAFYLSGLCLITSAVFVVLVDYLVQKREAIEMEANPQRSQGTGKFK